MNDMRDFFETRIEQLRQAFQRIGTSLVPRPVALTFIELADLSHFLIGKQSARMARQGLRHTLMQFRPTAFSNRIALILQISPEKQVIRPYARWIVALVKHLHAFWDRAIVQFPRNSMRLCPSAWFVTNFDNAVTEGMLVSDPEPAAISLLDFLPKAFCECLCERGGHERGRF